MDPLLSPAILDMQTSLFKQVMKEQARGMLQRPLTLNPVTRLWRSIEANSYFKHALSEFIKIVEIAIVMVLGLVQDERTFSTVTFAKNKLRNQLTTNLGLVVAFQSQNFYTIDSFPYDATFESWRIETKRQCETN
jgi:hypothetical protein